MTNLKEIAKVENSRFYDKTGKADEIAKVVEAIRNVDKVIPVLNEKVAPYSFYIPMKEIVDRMDDWKNYSHTSRSILIAELNGCIEIVNCRIRSYKEDDVDIRILVGSKAGIVKTVKQSVAKEFIEDGFAELA